MDFIFVVLLSPKIYSKSNRQANQKYTPNGNSNNDPKSKCTLSFLLIPVIEWFTSALFLIFDFVMRRLSIFDSGAINQALVTNPLSAWIAFTSICSCVDASAVRDGAAVHKTTLTYLHPIMVFST